MLITVILTSALICFTCCYLISRAYEAQIDWYRSTWQRQRQTIFFQFARIEELEIERETLHGIAVKALSVPDVEDYHEAGGVEITVWRN